MTRAAAPFLAVSVVLLAACAVSPTPIPSVATPLSSSGPLRADAVVDPFRLSIELPRTVWQVGAPITGTASLVNTSAQDVPVSRSGSGILAFAYSEVGGTRRIVPVSTSDCQPDVVKVGAPLTSGLTKSGGFSDTDPDAAFMRAFFTGSDVRLPAGDWEIAAEARMQGVGCAAGGWNLVAKVVIRVVP